jgi:CDP-glucose 4,6-dehydratase
VEEESGLENMEMMDFLDLYKGKKVLITGHTGFKGGWLAIWLDMLGAKVLGYALDPTYEKGIFQSSGIADHIMDYRADIRDRNKLFEFFKKEQPEIVFHLAAQPLVLESYKNPVETFEVNVQGTVNVLEAIRQTTSVKVAVMITTDKCYENKEWLWGYRENEPMGGHDPYSASKGAAELVINAYRRSFFMEDGKTAIASARAGNVIGGGDWSENRLVPDIIKAIMDKKTVEIRNPHAIRPWQHVLDPLCGYLKLGAALVKSPGQFSEAWNFGPFNYNVHPVKDVVEKIISLSGKGEWKDLSLPRQLHEATILMLDITKAVQKLKWQPILNLNESIKLTVDWYKDALGYDTLPFSQNQIKQYLQLWKLRNGK